MDTLYFEDLKVGQELTAGEYQTSAEDMVEFALKWDPLPIHIDEEAAKASAYGGLVASGEYTMAVKQLLINRLGISQAIIGSVGYDELRYLNPVRPGDRLSVHARCIYRRESRTRPDRGVVKFDVTLANQAGESVLAYTDIVIVARRNSANHSSG